MAVIITVQPEDPSEVGKAQNLADVLVIACPVLTHATVYGGRINVTVTELYRRCTIELLEVRPDSPAVPPKVLPDLIFEDEQ